MGQNTSNASTDSTITTTNTSFSPKHNRTSSSSSFPISSTECFIHLLDDNIIAHILSQLDFTDYPAFSIVNKQWSLVSKSSELVWKAMFRAEFRFTLTVLRYGTTSNESNNVQTLDDKPEGYWKQTFLSHFNDREVFHKKLEEQLRTTPMLKAQKSSAEPKKGTNL